jgi:hypothetical protein
MIDGTFPAVLAADPGRTAENAPSIMGVVGRSTPR